MKISTRTLVQLALLTGIEIIFAFTVFGSIPIGPIVATLAHIPVIIAAIYLGYGAGTYMGFLFGLLSFIVHSFVTPGPTSFVFTPLYSIGDVSGNFWSIIICFVPRILLGVVAAFIYQTVAKYDKKKYIASGVAAVISTLIHTVLVLGGIYVFFGESYAAVNNMAFDLLFGAIMTVVGTNGVPEALIAGVVAVALAKPMTKLQK